MTTNRLATSDSPRIAAPSDPAERRQFWIERGNRILWGQEPNSKGIYLPPQTDMEWVCRDGFYSIQPR